MISSSLGEDYSALNNSCLKKHRILEEGGYEAVDSMIYYAQPSPWAPSVEATIVNKVKDMVARMRGEE